MFARNRFATVFLTLSLLGVVSVVAFADDVQARKVADWRTLAKLNLQFAAEFDSQGKFTRGGGKYMADYTRWKQASVPFWAGFQKRYGATWEAIQPHFEGVPKPEGTPQGIDYVVRSVLRINLERHEAQMAQWAESHAKGQHRHWKRMYDQNDENVEVMMRHADRSAGFMKLAARLNPSGDYAAGIQAGEEAVSKTVPRYKAHLKDKTWPPHNASYKGANAPDALAAAALAFLRENPGWTAPEFDDTHVPVAAVVAGSTWSVYKVQPIMEKPLQFSIKMLVAFTGEKQPDLAYCYTMEFYTAEGLGVQPALPFKYANSRQFECYRMLREKLP